MEELDELARTNTDNALGTLDEIRRRLDVYPGLLAACKAAVEWLALVGPSWSKPEWADMAEAAIAKAEPPEGDDGAS